LKNRTIVLSRGNVRDLAFLIFSDFTGDAFSMNRSEVALPS
jgi:hypothetical protein